jgi:hypothetical protein
MKKILVIFLLSLVLASCIHGKPVRVRPAYGTETYEFDVYNVPSEKKVGEKIYARFTRTEKSGAMHMYVTDSIDEDTYSVIIVKK